MTPQELRKSIIQLALKGELTNHSSNQSVDNLLKDIKQKKDELIKKGVAKKVIPTVFEEVPYDLPDSWKWVKLSDIAYVNGGYAFKSTDYKSSGIRIIRISDFNENGFVNNKIVRQDYKNEYEPFMLSNNDILLCMTGGTVGKSYYVENMSEPMVTNQRVATIKIINPCKKFINYAILSPLVQKIIQDSKNSTNDNISMDLINDFPIPLPPLEEQERIVEKIEELLPLVDHYEEAWSKLEKFNKKFPIDMEKSILQYAIQGKLVNRDLAEGNAKDLLIEIKKQKTQLVKQKIIKKDNGYPSVEEDEKLFKIPENWVWCRLGEIGGWQSGSTPSKSEPKYYSNGTIPWLVTGDLNNGYLDDVPGRITELALCETSVKLNPPGSVLIAMYGATIGKLAIINFPCTTNQACCACVHVEAVDKKYLFYYLLTLKDYFIGRGEGGAQPNISREKIVFAPFALPPLGEQKRIVAKLEELLPLCRKLIK